MIRLRRKLKSSTGASMLLGLLFLLFCLTVGAVVLTAASVSAGRTARNRQVQQNYLAVQSAANLLMDDMEDMEFTGKFILRVETTYHSGWTDAEGNYHSPPPPTVVKSNAHDKELKKTEFHTILEDYCYKLFLSSDFLDAFRVDNAASVPDAVTSTLTVAEQEGVPGESPGLPAVTLEVTLGTPAAAGTAEYSDEGYTITIQAHLSEPAPEGDHGITLVLTPEVNTSTDQSSVGGNPVIETTTVTSTVTWKAAVATKGAAAWEN